MLFEDSYQTISKPAEALFKDRGSKFLAFAFPVQNEEDIKKHLQNLRELHPKATHHCYAYRLGLDRTCFRVNDDGEPAGTAGKPILNVLYTKNLTNILVVVVRYFGGTLLGVPGLINAYKQAATEALNKAEIVTKFIVEIYQIHYDYASMNEVMKVLKTHHLKIRKQVFDNDCFIEIEFRKSMEELILSKLSKIEGTKIINIK